MTRRTLYMSMAIYFIIVFGFIIFPPTVEMVNRIHPYILGLPCFQFVILLIPFLIALGLMFFYFMENKIDERESLSDGGDAL